MDKRKARTPSRVKVKSRCYLSSIKNDLHLHTIFSPSKRIEIFIFVSLHHESHEHGRRNINQGGNGTTAKMMEKILGSTVLTLCIVGLKETIIKGLVATRRDRRWAKWDVYRFLWKTVSRSVVQISKRVSNDASDAFWILLQDFFRRSDRRIYIYIYIYRNFSLLQRDSRSNLVTRYSPTFGGTPKDRTFCPIQMSRFPSFGR